MKTLILRSGNELPAPLVNMVYDTLFDLVSTGDFLSLVVAYDLLELTKDPEYYKQCTGPSRAKLLETGLVKGDGTQGPLIMDHNVRDIIQCSVVVQDDVVIIQSPLKPW